MVFLWFSYGSSLKPFDFGVASQVHWGDGIAAEAIDVVASAAAEKGFNGGDIISAIGKP